jgi:hypothetical protein
MRRYATGVIVGLALIVGASPAAAATTVGQISTQPDPTNCPAFTAEVTTSVNDGPAYTVPAGGGVITSWLTNVGTGGSDVNAKLKIFRPTGTPSAYQVVGQSGFQPMSPGTLNGPFPVRIPVQSGDYVSILPGSNGGPCDIITGNGADLTKVSQGQPDAADGAYTLFATLTTGRRANVSASVEPDADRDGFGDETQDQCPSDASAQGACPAAAPPVPTSGGRAAAIKRCKKKFPHGKKRKHCITKAKRRPA